MAVDPIGPIDAVNNSVGGRSRRHDGRTSLDDAV